MVQSCDLTVSAFTRECICIHLKSNVEKFYLLCMMTRKLFTFAKQECTDENLDSLMTQEALTSGQLYIRFLKASGVAPHTTRRERCSSHLCLMTCTAGYLGRCHIYEGKWCTL